MSRDARFWRNVTIIALVHVAILLGLIRWSRETKRSRAKDIVWMNAGAGEASEAVTQSAMSSSTAPVPKEELLPTPTPEITPEPTKPEKTEEDEPVLPAAKSDIQLSTPTPKPTPSATRTPAPKPTPTAKPTPKPTPKPTATPKPSPKKLLAKASPKPKPSASPKAKAENEESDATKKKKAIAKAALAKEGASEENGASSEKPTKKATAAHGSKKSGSAGAEGDGSGAGGASEFGWYGNMLHDRLYSEWVQPTTVVASGAKISALVKIRIEKDGTVSDFKIIKPSGNVVIDESVEAVAKRVTQVDPLPAGLVDGDHYDVNINFEFNPSE
jgi:colicin import membrane protein